MAPINEHTRYLLSKRSVDDRALNRLVVDAVRTGVGAFGHRVRVLEVGAGVGTMVARALDWQILSRADYVVLDSDRESLRFAQGWLQNWATSRGMQVAPRADGLHLSSAGGVDIGLRFVHAELETFLHERPSDRVDLVVANAVLDLVDLGSVVPRLLELLAPRGLYWFSINFDGETIFLPEHGADQLLSAVYHKGMDERRHGGLGWGDSRTGRRLFGALRAAGAPLLEAGSSDWVVFAGADGYRHDERFFLEYILSTIQAALRARSAEIPPEVLQDWMDTRRAQLARGELVYIAHQLDFCGALA